jgi:hypothetical protein
MQLPPRLRGTLRPFGVDCIKLAFCLRNLLLSSFPFAVRNFLKVGRLSEAIMPHKAASVYLPHSRISSLYEQFALHTHGYKHKPFQICPGLKVGGKGNATRCD